MEIRDHWLVEAQDGHYGAKSSDRGGYAPKWLVLHGTAGGASAAAIDNYFATSTVQASAHVIIGQDGTVIQGISFDQAAWANCCTSPGHASYLADGDFHNRDTISIEHVKAHDDNSDTLTPIQAQKSFEVVACICDAYGIPKRPGDANGGIISHADLDPVNRSRCPGAYPWSELWDYLNGGPMNIYGPEKGDFDQWFVPNDDSHWTCKQTGATLQFGNLALYRQLSIDGVTLPIVGLPRTNEIYQTESDGYGWSVQFCERGVIVYDSAHRQDSQPGFGTSYLGKYAQFQYLDPEAKIVERVPAPVLSSLGTIQSEIEAVIKVASQ